MVDSRRILVAVLIATGCLWLAVAFSATVIVATEVFLLTFLGVLFAVFLTRCSRLLAQGSGLSYRWSLGVTSLVLGVLFTGSLYFFGRQIEEQVRRASSQLDESTRLMREWVNDRPLAKAAVSDLPFARQILNEDESSGSRNADPDGSQTQGDSNSTSTGSSDSGSSDSGSAGGSSSQPSEDSQSESDESEEQSDQQSGESSGSGLSGSRIGQAARIVTSVFRTTFGLITNLAIVVIVGLYLAADPELYRDGAVRLFPQKQRGRVGEILDRMGNVLWWWLLGRFTTMLITGAGTGIALALIGVPLPFMLGVMTGLLAFIPNFGPAIGLAVALLVSLPRGGNTLLLVTVVFLLFQLLESYLLTPLIQQRLVEIPPALLLVWQVLLGVLTGFLGLMVATPLLAVLMQLVLLVWLEDILGDNQAAESSA